MKIPNKVKIGGVTYDVIITKNVDKSDKNIDGLIIYDKQEIIIEEGLPKEYGEQIFLHEILHRIFEFLDLDNNEEIIRPLSTALYMVIKDNPEIFKE